jgi:hypothetical protein
MCTFTATESPVETASATLVKRVFNPGRKALTLSYGKKKTSLF